MSDNDYKKLSTLLTKNRDAIIGRDLHGIITFWNEGACSMYGYTEDEVRDKSIEILIPPGRNIEIPKTLSEIRTLEETGVFESIRRKKDGSEIHVSIQILVLTDENGTLTEVYSFTREINDQKELENRLLNTIEKAKENIKTKDKFVSLVAHDLKSPLTAVMGLLEITFPDPAHNLPEREQKLIRQISDIGENMIEMIDNLLNISRLQTGKVTPRQHFMDAYSLTSWATGSLLFLAKQKGIAVRNIIPRKNRIYTDSALFAEVIKNLVTNAIKFCQKGDVITIFQKKSEGDTITLAIEDTGIGMDKKVLANLFKDGSRTTRVGTAGEKSTGFGLKYCDEIMKAHGGNITAFSKDGQGSIFYLTFPLVKPQILLLEPDKKRKSQVLEMLLKYQMNCDCAATGQGGLKRLESRIPHLIIINDQTPGLEVLFHFLQLIREDPASYSIPFILMGDNSYITNCLTTFRLKPALKISENTPSPVKMINIINDHLC